MSIPVQAIEHAASKLYDSEARENIPMGSIRPWSDVRPVTRDNYMRRSRIILEAYQEWLRKGPGSGR